MGNTARKSARVMAASTLTKEAAEMRVRGLPWAEIAMLQGAADESVPRLRVESYFAKLPRENVEAWKKMLLARLDKAHRSAEALLAHVDVDVRLKAALTVANIAGRVAKITGIEKDNVLVQVNPGVADEEFDLSRLSMEEIAQLRAIRAKLSGPARLPVLDAAGHTVEEENNAERIVDSEPGTGEVGSIS